MVKIGKITWLIFSLLFCFSMNITAVEIKAEVDEEDAFEYRPVEVFITIKHLKAETIDQASFKLGENPIKVSLTKEETDIHGIVTSYYHFFIPEQPKGLHILPSLSAKVGEKQYSTPPTTYVLKASPDGAILRLQAEVKSQYPLYPGIYAHFLYMISYRGEIQLTKETLPLLEANGFQKIGEKEVTDSTDGSLLIQTISQRVRALKPGQYTFPHSTLEGIAILPTKKIPIKAETQPLTVTVNAFPLEGMPPSFNGAVGQFSWTVTMKNTPTLHVGDKITLDISVTGRGEFDTVTLSPIGCQPGFSGFFSFDDIPPAGTWTGKSKNFSLELRPFNPMVEEVPPIEFSFFDPFIAKYYTLKSSAIPLQIQRTEQDYILPIASSVPIKKPAPVNPSWQGFEKSNPYPLKSELNLASASFLGLPLPITTLVLALAAISLIIAQYFVHCMLLKHNARSQQKKYSYALLQSAKKEPTLSNASSLIQQSLMVALTDKGIVKTPSFPPYYLPSAGITGEVKAFLSKLDANQYSSQTKTPLQDLIAYAQTLWKKIQTL